MAQRVGVALSGRPSAPRIRAIASCTIRGDRGPPFAPTNNGRARLESIGAKRQIVLDRLAHRSDDWRRARFWPLPTIVIASVSPTGARRVESKGLRDAQARAVAEREHRGVARQHPGFARLAVAKPSWSSPWRLSELNGRGRRRPALGARTAPSARLFPAFASDMAGERFKSGKRALQRAGVDSFRPPVGEEGAQIARRALSKIGDAGGGRNAPRERERNCLASRP